jgi:hypothetical protein
MRTPLAGPYQYATTQQPERLPVCGRTIAASTQVLFSDGAHCDPTTYHESVDTLGMADPESFIPAVPVVPRVTLTPTDGQVGAPTNPPTLSGRLLPKECE